MMKKSKSVVYKMLACVFMALLLSMFMVACSPESENPESETVKITIVLPVGVGYDGYIHEQDVEKGSELTLPNEVELSGIPEWKEMDGWYVGTDRLTENKITVNENVTVELRLKDKEVPKAEKYSVSFVLPDGIGFKDYVPTTEMQANQQVTLPTADQLSGLSADMTFEWAVQGGVLSENTVTVNGDTIVTLKVYARVTVECVKNFTVTEDYGRTYQVGEKIDLPSENQITNTTGKNVIGWYYENDKGIRTEVGEDGINMSLGGLVIGPVFEQTGTALTAAKFVTEGGGSMPDFLGYFNDDLTVWTDSSKSGITIKDAFKVTPAVIANEKGVIFSLDNYTLVKNGGFRLKTGAPVEAAKNYHVYYGFMNYGATEVSFRIYQVNSGSKVTAAGVVKSDVVTVAAGGCAYVQLDLTGFTNNNLCTFIVMEKEVAGMQLGISMSYEQFTP